MEKIYLTNPHDSVSITTEGYQCILQIVEQTKICCVCEKPYEPDRPEVAKNLCLGCFLLKHKNRIASYVRSLVQRNYRDQEETAYWFLDYFGQVIVTTAMSDNQHLTAYTYETLQHWRFPVPARGLVDDIEQDLPHWYWKIHGDFQTSPIVLLENTLDYRGTNSVFFFSERDSTCEQVFKRRGKLRALLIEAKKRIEATKDSHGYHMDDHSFYQISDYHLYEMVVILANEARQPSLITPEIGKEEQTT